MRQLMGFVIFIALMVFVSNTAAEVNICTDAKGNVTYTYLPCPPGYEAKSFGGVVDGNPTFSQQELDQMLAPIALYPDSLLSLILMAATYPLEVVEAARWSRANSSPSGEAAVQAVNIQNWDPSIKSLVAFPQVLQTLDQKIEWTERLGDAFLSQQSQVMDTVQHLRQKAQMAGNLNSNSLINISQSNDSIDIEETNPNVVYVPYYDPSVIYGNWWWTEYPPVFWSPWTGYGWYSGLAWGLGIGVGVDFFSGTCDWRNHHVYPHGSRYSGTTHPWQHDPSHRHGVPYRDAALNLQFGRVTKTSVTRAEFRGHESSASASLVQQDNHQHTESARVVPLPTSRSLNQSVVEPRAHAFENVGSGADVRNFSARGNASVSGSHGAPQSSHESSPHARH